jgi:hypothetical protein
LVRFYCLTLLNRGIVRRWMRDRKGERLAVGEGECSRVELMIVLRPTELKSPKSKPRSEVFQRTSHSLSPRWTNTDPDSDEQIIEALKSKKFKVITITHGQPLPTVQYLANPQSIHPPESYPPLPKFPNSSKHILPIP